MELVSPLWCEHRACKQCSNDGMSVAREALHLYNYVQIMHRTNTSAEAAHTGTFNDGQRTTGAYDHLMLKLLKA